MIMMIVIVDELIDFFKKYKKKGFKYVIIVMDFIGGWRVLLGKKKYY